MELLFIKLGSGFQVTCWFFAQKEFLRYFFTVVKLVRKVLQWGWGPGHHCTIHITSNHFSK
jgi:hypothetical protein